MSERIALHVLRAWHSWRCAWWQSLVAQAEQMRDYHNECRHGLQRRLYPPEPLDFDILRAEIDREPS